MLRFTSRPVTALLLATSLFLVSCAIPTETCGVRRSGAHGGLGPAVLETREQEVCEITRRRVFLFLQGTEGLSNATLDDWRHHAVRLRRVESVQVLVTSIRASIDAELATSVAAGIAQVRERSKKPYGEAAERDIDRALARAAAHGLRLAFEAVEVADDSKSLIDAANAEFPDELTD